jgi:hypothetical protein
MLSYNPLIQFMIFTVILFIYFLPALIALFRNHRNDIPIFLTNLLLGWTVLGWAIALIWSTTNDLKPLRTTAVSERRLTGD